MPGHGADRSRGGRSGIAHPRARHGLPETGNEPYARPWTGNTPHAGYGPDAGYGPNAWHGRPDAGYGTNARNGANARPNGPDAGDELPDARRRAPSRPQRRDARAPARATGH